MIGQSPRRGSPAPRIQIAQNPLRWLPAVAAGYAVQQHVETCVAPGLSASVGTPLPAPVSGMLLPPVLGTDSRRRSGQGRLRKLCFYICAVSSASAVSASIPAGSRNEPVLSPPTIRDLKLAEVDCDMMPKARAMTESKSSSVSTFRGRRA